MSDGVNALITQARIVGLPEPVTEYRFCSRRWRFDLAWKDRKIAAEVDGATWVNGRHTRGKGFENDCEKINSATALGWKVFRFTTGMVERGEAIQFLERVFEED